MGDGKWVQQLKRNPLTKSMQQTAQLGATFV